MENPNNRIIAVGRLDGELELSHEVMNEPFYTGTLLVKRLSGAVDRLPVTIPGKLMGLLPQEDCQLLMTGQVRSYNKVVDGAGRLMVTLFVQSIAQSPDNDTLNRVSLTGSLCKPPIYRSTPFGREICDMMLAPLRAGDLRHDAGGESRLRQERLYSLHRLGAQRPIRLPLQRGGSRALDGPSSVPGVPEAAGERRVPLPKRLRGVLLHAGGGRKRAGAGLRAGRKALCV